MVRRLAILSPVLVAVACSAPPSMRLSLPAEALTADVHTLLVSLEQEGAFTHTLIDLDDRATEPALPGIAEWDDTPAAYTVQSFRETVRALELVAGPVVPNTDPALAVQLPAAAQVFRAELSVEPPTAWVSGAPVPPAIAALQLTRSRRPVDCSTSFVRSLDVGSESIDVADVIATSPDTALVVMSENGVFGLGEIQPDGTAEPRPLPPEIGRLTSFATDSRHVWATDVSDRVVLLDLTGGLVAFGEPGALDQVISSPDGRTVYGWRGDDVVRLVAGSTQTTAVVTAPNGPPRVDLLGPSPTGDLVVLAGSDVWVFSGGAWRNEFRASADFGRVTAVAGDERGYYAVTGAALFSRGIDDMMWAEVPDIGTFERTGVLSYGDGRVVVVGVGGFIEVTPNRPPFTGWCQIITGTFREIEKVSVDPTRRTLFATDRNDRDNTERGTLVLRVTLPQ